MIRKPQTKPETPKPIPKKNPKPSTTPYNPKPNPKLPTVPYQPLQNPVCRLQFHRGPVSDEVLWASTTGS